MMSFTKLLKISLLLLASAMMTSCSLDEKSDPNLAGSALPWNRPQSWEGAGPLGSAMQGSR
jgi:outer membrane biogenesis lipoprotein LolB